MLKRLQSSIAYRAKWARLGVFYARQPTLDAVRIAGKSVCLSFPESERAVHEFEFGKIVFEDCYRLSDVPPARTVLDIGANIGLFTLAVRNRFPNAIIHSYEPNPDLQPHLAAHCDAVSAQRFPVAVGTHAGSISLKASNEGSLFSITQSGGAIPQVAFAEAVARLGTVDLLKLDCEGAEWDIFTDPAPWSKVRSLVMEYHLWAKSGATIETLERCLRDLGFKRIQYDQNGASWGMAYADRSNHRTEPCMN